MMKHFSCSLMLVKSFYHLRMARHLNIKPVYEMYVSIATVQLDLNFKNTCIYNGTCTT